MQILLADDHPIFRKGLKALIEDYYEHCVIVEVDNGIDAIDKLMYESFTICVLDIDMPGKSGIDVLRFIKNKAIKVKPVMLTMHNDELFFNEAFDIAKTHPLNEKIKQIIYNQAATLAFQALLYDKAYEYNMLAYQSFTTFFEIMIICSNKDIGFIQSYH